MALTEKQKAAAKAYRDRIMAAAQAGGYQPKKRTGLGLSEKRTSKHGTTYYYQPWASLSNEQKAKRLAQSRKYAAETRALAAAYRAEHAAPGGATKKRRK